MSEREQDSSTTSRPAARSRPTDWLPDDYRAKLIKFIEMHGNSELMGVLPEREWILRAPTLQRKLALTAKVQDEVGHSQLIYRVVEDLGKPREQCLDDLISGKSKFHNVFHYPTKTWGDVGVIAWLVDAAAIISQKALLKCSYAPYARIMKKICWEESFHILHGRDVILDADERHRRPARARAGSADRWWGPLMQFHGNPIPTRTRIRCTSGGSSRRETRRRASSSSTATSRRSGSSGSPFPTRSCGRTSDGVWEYTEPDWDELKQRRHRPRPEVAGPARPAGGWRARTPRGCARSCSRKLRKLIFEVFRQERKGQPLQHAGSVEAADDTSRTSTRASNTAAAASRRRSGSSRAQR